MKKLLLFINENFIVRRACVISSVVLSWVCFTWSMRYADTHTGTEAATIIGAVLVPVATFTAATFKFYSDARDITPKEEKS